MQAAIGRMELWLAKTEYAIVLSTLTNKNNKECIMKLDIKQLLAAKNIHPDEAHLKKLEQKWQETLQLKGDLTDINLDDADIALKNIAGGDHHG